MSFKQGAFKAQAVPEVEPERAPIIGGAWNKTSAHGEYLSVSLDTEKLTPLLEGAGRNINLIMFPNEKPQKDTSPNFFLKVGYGNERK